MNVTVLYFAAVAEELGTREQAIDMPVAATIGDVMSKLETDSPSLIAWRDRLAFARNEAYASADTVLQDGDTVALIPPVSGG
ncbi:MAG: molybdopterin converting factor subunit 1 [Planctomycetota bacterium]